MKFIVSYIFFFLLPFTCLAQDYFLLDKISSSSEVQLKQNTQGGWVLYVDGKPYMIKGMTYEPVKVGNKFNASNQWMNYDYNNNSINDTAYESWVDINYNNRRDKKETDVGDFQLMKHMGVNTIRIYHPTNIKKELLRDLYERFGIRVIMGNLLGAYCWGSGADWRSGTDYTNRTHIDNMLEDVKQTVLEHKDEPYLLMWLLGNENDSGGSYQNSTYKNTNATSCPKEFAQVVAQATKLIHSLDPKHPVGVCNSTYKMLPYYRDYASNIDYIAFNSYSGPYGFGSLFRTVKFYFDKPVLISEYGVDSYDQRKRRQDQEAQVDYHRGAWRDIKRNSFKFGGNCIGAVAYTWLDSWWLCGSAKRQDTKKGAWRGPAKDGWFNDEWLGICSQGNGRHSPYMRQLKKVYYYYKEEWNGQN